MKANIIYITTPTHDEADNIAQILLQEKLIACANILPEITSYYNWENKTQTNKECILLIKTRFSLVEKIIEKVKQIHSYTCPCIVSIPIQNAYTPFIEWIYNETKDIV